MEDPKIKFIVCHGSVSGVQLGKSILMTQKQADHINEGGKMLRRFDEKPTPVEQVTSVLRKGLEGEKVTPIGGTIISTDAETEEIEEPAEEEAPAPKPAKAAKPAGKINRTKKSKES